MRRLGIAACIGLALMLAACSRFQRPSHGAAPSVTAGVDTLVSIRGVSMPLEKAVRGIAFHPFIPSIQIVDVALIAPLTGTDNRDNRGIAFEYASGGEALVLSEWPLHNLHPSVGASDLDAAPCAITRYKSDGVLWTTPRRLVMTLQPDGKVKSSHILAEARRLLRRGGCT